jgi:hypothetical protein
VTWRADNDAVAVVQRFESSAGPVAVGGRTISLVTRTRALTFGNENGVVFHVRSRPSHVEVLEDDGRRHVVAVRDVQRIMTAAIVAVTAACVVGTRVARRAR